MATSTTIVIHGGAGTIRAEDRDNYVAGLLEARDAGFAALEAGKDALEAILITVATMEDNTAAFNAGTGGSPNREGVVECDAAVMAGWDRSVGAVAAVSNAKNPVLLADKVRRASPHVFLVGVGAEALVDEPIDNQALLTERTRAALSKWREKKLAPANSATVGAVALDQNGRLAAATSTGGVLGKWPGRVGDSPIVGAGTYADAHIAVSCTGKGEAFTRAVTAKSLATRLHYEEDLQSAVRASLEEVQTLEGSGGLITVTAGGRVCVGFNTPHMAYAWKSDSAQEVKVGLEAGLFHP